MTASAGRPGLRRCATRRSRHQLGHRVVSAALRPCLHATGASPPSRLRRSHCARKRRHSACSSGDALTGGGGTAAADERRRPRGRSGAAGTRPLRSMSRSSASRAPCSVGAIAAMTASDPWPVAVATMGGRRWEGERLRGRCRGSMPRRCPMDAGTSCVCIVVDREVAIVDGVTVTNVRPRADDAIPGTRPVCPAERDEAHDYMRGDTADGRACGRTVYQARDGRVGVGERNLTFRSPSLDRDLFFSCLECTASQRSSLFHALPLGRHRRTRSKLFPRYGGWGWCRARTRLLTLEPRRDQGAVPAISVNKSVGSGYSPCIFTVRRGCESERYHMQGSLPLARRRSSTPLGSP